MLNKLYKKYSHFLAKYIVQISILFVFVVLAIISYATVLSYKEKWESSKKFADNILHSKMWEIEKNLQLYDRALKRTIDVLDEFGATRIPENVRRELFFDVSPSVNGLDEIFIFNQSGDLVARSSDEKTKSETIRGCQSFTFHKESATSEFSLDRFCPVTSPEAPLALSMSRRLTDKEGRFAGVVVAKISLTYIRDSFKDLSLGRDGLIFLANDEGTLLARVPEPQEHGVIGRNFSKSAIYDKIQEAKSGSFLLDSDIDRVNRLYLYSYISNSPLIIGVAISKDAIITEWYKRVFAMLGGSVLVCLAMVLITIIVRKEILRREEVEKKLEQLSVTDSLTGLFNRRYFDEKLKDEWRRAKRNQIPLSILMIDGDKFKELNDQFGHRAGDDALIRISQAIQKSLQRAGDCAARYGGDEFIVVLPNTDQKKALQVAKNIKMHLEHLNEVTDCRLTNDFKPISISVGVASCIPSGEDEVGDLVKQADENLYHVKTSRAGDRRPQKMKMLAAVES